ncbi:hypothetical protein BUE80_DR010054, partial [Diplocarpon rosae]
IYVVENTGVMDSNAQARLSLQNPFFLNHTRLHLLGVHIIVTPTLFTFAQLQNFYLWHSIQSQWTHYFWSHMDVVAVSFEDQYVAAHEQSGRPIRPPSDPQHDYSDFTSLYANCVKALREATTPTPPTGDPIRWAMRFFSYDRLALVNVAAFVEVGGWDTMIPFYMTDCDMHARLEMAKYHIEEMPSGMVFDVGSSLDDLLVLYRKRDAPEAAFLDPNVVATARAPAAAAAAVADTTHVARAGGSDLSAEAWLQFAAGALHLPGAGKDQVTWADDEIHSPSFVELIAAIWMTIEHGRHVFREKWGHRDCDIVKMGLRPSDAWRVEHDWEG